MGGPGLGNKSGGLFFWQIRARTSASTRSCFEEEIIQLGGSNIRWWRHTSAVSIDKQPQTLKIIILNDMLTMKQVIVSYIQL